MTPLQRNILDNKFRCEFTIIFKDSEPPSEGLNEGLFENTPNCFDHVPDIAEQPKTAYWIEKSASFNIICITCNMSEPIAAKSPRK
jgi:hypothetical protein